MAEMCMCRLDLTRWGRRDSGRLESVIPGVKNGVFMFSDSFFFLLFPLSSTLPSAMTTNSGRGNVEQGSSHLCRYYLLVFASRCEAGNGKLRFFFFGFFLKFRILTKKLGDFTWKQLFNFVWDHKMSTTGFLNAIWLWGDVSVHVLMLKASSSHCFYNAVAWSRDI